MTEKLFPFQPEQVVPEFVTKLEDAFDLPEVIDKENVQVLRLVELYKKLLEETWWKQEKQHTFSYENVNFLEVFSDKLRRCPADIETIKTRQATIGNLLQAQEHDEAFLVASFKTVKDSSGFFNFNGHINTDNQFNRFNIEGCYEYLKKMESDEPKKILANVLELLEKLPEKTHYMDEMAQSIQSVMTKLPALVANLQEFRQRMEPTVEYQKLLSRAARNEKPIKPDGVLSEKQFATYVKRAQNSAGFLKEICQELDNLSIFIVLAEVVKANELKPVEIVEGQAIDFKGALHPFLVHELGRKNVVPQDVSFSNNQAIEVLTGLNATGKSKRVETVALNCVLAQNTGYAYAEGGHYSPRSRFCFIGATEQPRADEVGESYGEHEMRLFIEQLKKLPPGSMLLIDEALRSTDSTGASAILIAALEDHARSGGIGMHTIHSREMLEYYQRGLTPSVQYISAKVSASGEATYTWEAGVGRAQPVELAVKLGIKPEIAVRAGQLQRALDSE